MSVLRLMLKYVGYYILVMILLAVFSRPAVRELLSTLCGAALSVSMFASVIQLLLGGSIGAAAQRTASWLLRGTVIITAIVVIAGLGFDNIARLFTGS